MDDSAPSDISALTEDLPLSESASEPGQEIPDMHTVYVIDDDPAVLNSLAAMVRAMGLNSSCHASAEEFLDAYDPSVPGCLVLDIRMPGMSGIDLQEHLKSRNLQVPVIIISGHGDVPIAVRAMQLGAFDFLEKPYRTEQLRERITQAIELDSRRREARARYEDIEARLADLTEEERLVMDHIVGGKTNKEIASQLDVSLRTVQFRRSSMMKKLNVLSRAELVEVIIRAREPRDESL